MVKCIQGANSISCFPPRAGVQQTALKDTRESLTANAKLTEGSLVCICLSRNVISNIEQSLGEIKYKAKNICRECLHMVVFKMSIVCTWVCDSFRDQAFPPHLKSCLYQTASFLEFALH